LANSKTQNAFLFTVHAIFRHDYPLAVEPASTLRPLVQKNFERFSTYWYAPFCRVCLGCRAVEFRSSGGTYKQPCMYIYIYICIYIYSTNIHPIM